MDLKHDPSYEHKIKLLAENRLQTGVYKVFDIHARIITRWNLPELVDQKQTDNPNCLVITNSKGETIVITEEFEMALRHALNNKS